MGSQKQRRNYSAQCDALAGKICRSAGRCHICGSTEFIQWAHGIPRSYRATRWDSRNCWPLCRSCHVYYTHRPLEWREWMLAEMGEELFSELSALALSHARPDLPSLLAELKARWAELEHAS